MGALVTPDARPTRRRGGGGGAGWARVVPRPWLLDAFGSAGFLWVNGERGTGKSTLMLVICELAHLGQALSPSGSFAALRDIADYGACMGLDDAESWTNPEKTNPDIRAIVLSGNRRGVFVPVKEALPNGNWQTRRVNCFCPRVFT